MVKSEKELYDGYAKFLYDTRVKQAINILETIISANLIEGCKRDKDKNYIIYIPYGNLKNNQSEIQAGVKSSDSIWNLELALSLGYGTLVVSDAIKEVKKHLQVLGYAVDMREMGGPVYSVFVFTLSTSKGEA